MKHTLIEESIIVALVCVVFLLHLRSALVAILMLPVGILMAFVGMKLTRARLQHHEPWRHRHRGRRHDRRRHRHDRERPQASGARAARTSRACEILIEAASEVGPALFFSLLIITVSFLPIFTLESQEGRLFGPLAFTKTFSMAAAALLSVTLVPALMVIFVRGRIIPEHRNPINRFLIWRLSPDHPGRAEGEDASPSSLALAALAASVWPARQLGSEFMPNLNEGTLMYMPTTLPGISVTKAAELLQTQDRIIKSFPEVESVYGKAGRAATATDPAPTEMFETIINLKPKEQWRPGVTIDSLKAEMDKALQFPGVSNAWTMPIRARIDMLATGIRTPVGVKVFGTDLAEMEKIARQIEAVLKTVPGTSSAYAERVIGGYYLDIVPDREALGRYGLTIGDVQDVIATALGGETITTTVEGRERYGVNIRYPRDLRSNPQAIATDVQVPLPGGGAVPLGEVAKVKLTRGATTIRTENGQLAVYIFVDIDGRDLGGYVADAQKAVAAAGEAAAGLLRRLERPVRISRAGRGAAEDRRAGHAADHLPAALSQLPGADRDADRHAVAALRAGRRRLADVVARLQHVGRRRGRLHRARGRRGRDRRRHADLSRSGDGGSESGAGTRRPAVHARRPPGGDHARRGRAGAAEDDDGRRHHGRPAADPVEHRHRLGGHAAHRRADDRRHDLVDRADAGRDPGDLWADQRMAATHRAAASRVTPARASSESGRMIGGCSNGGL